ncbi:ATP-binding protein [bacterium]|nr:ATP-binding protein [bacterium]
MKDFEKLGLFYLGRQYDLENKQLMKDQLLYDSKDLVTHAMCVGMTGSGKTGLCIGILEEAAIDGIPAIVVDPKGDLTNLLLTFPDLQPDDFLPWINQEDAGKKGLSADEYAAQQAQFWKDGLAEWDQDPDRIRRLKEAADFAIYTPGSSAGLPLSMLSSFSVPERVILDDIDLLTERVNTTVTSLLNLVGIEADPIQSREHILLSNILTRVWGEGRSLSLSDLIHYIQNPPVKRIGVFDLDLFFPEGDRFALAMSINNLLAAPAFKSWMEGDPLNIQNLLYTDNGKPRISIITISHLSDPERMFFVSLLLTQLLGWMRTQQGTSSLRALFYMDEIFGYFPPVANPPSKSPLMSLLKQGRAFGLGIVLATQNPVDLDYKGLSNCGTWFLGRLQTDQDKEKVLDGLEGVGSSAGGRFDRKYFDKMLSNLGKRVFLMNNVHEDEPVLFQTRWVLSYLRGPLTRSQIKILIDPKRKKSAKGHEISPEPTPSPALRGAVSHGTGKPALPPGIRELFMPIEDPPPDDGAAILYSPYLIAMGKVYHSSTKYNVSTEEEITLLTELTTSARWDDARMISLHEEDLERSPMEEEAVYMDLPQDAIQSKNYKLWEKGFKDWIYHGKQLELFRSSSLKEISEPGESEKDFRIRIQHAAREKRDEILEKARKKYDARISSLEKQILRAEQAVDREKDQASQQKFQTAVAFGATIFGALLGRKRVSRTSIGRAATTAQRAGRISKEAKDVQRAEERLVDLHTRLSELQYQLEVELSDIKASVDPSTEVLETVTIRARKSDISVTLLALCWLPEWQDN